MAFVLSTFRNGSASASAIFTSSSASTTTTSIIMHPRGHIHTSILSIPHRGAAQVHKSRATALTMQKTNSNNNMNNMASAAATSMVNEILKLDTTISGGKKGDDELVIYESSTKTITTSSEDSRAKSSSSSKTKRNIKEDGYSFYFDGMKTQRLKQTGEQGKDQPPLVYDKVAMKDYWKARPKELNARWIQFLSVATPFFTRVITDLATGKFLKDEKSIRDLAVMAREGMETLGPSYIKLGQIMSVRPDIVPEVAQKELEKLQDGVKVFSTEEAYRVIEEELGCPLTDIFSEISPEPIAAASLAQVYRGRLVSNGNQVAIKVQRPEALSTVSKDLYVLQRAVGLYQSIITRWTAQETDFVTLLDTFAEGFYSELDFLNEAKNQAFFRETIVSRTKGQVYVPNVYMDLCSRRLLVSEWVDGYKLTEAKDDELRQLTALGQQCFLEQLLEAPGYFHGDPHAGNILKVLDPSKLDHPNAKQARLCLLDFGLVTTVPENDRATIIRGIVHLANRDWDAVTQDFIDLGFLPRDIDRDMQVRVTGVMKRVLTPYIFQGGGAKAFLGDAGGSYTDKIFSPSFQALARDLNSAAREIPFKIPPYFAILARSITVLEGIALKGDPNYRLVMSSYPYVARRLLRDSSDTDAFRLALNEILYADSADSIGKAKKRLNPKRLVVLLNNALDRVADAKDGSGALVDLDTLPSDEASLSDLVDLLVSEDAKGIRSTLIDEVIVGVDLILRQLTRRSTEWITSALQPPMLPGPLGFLTQRLPSPIPSALVESALNKIAPPISTEEQVYVNDLILLAFEFLELDEDPEKILASPIQGLGVLRKLLIRLNSGNGKDDEVSSLVKQLGREVLDRNSESVRAKNLRDISTQISQRLIAMQRERVFGSN